MIRGGADALRRVAVVVIGASLVIGSIGCAGAAKRGSETGAAGTAKETYLSGYRLAGSLGDDVVVIQETLSGEVGMGVVVGGQGRHLLVVTPAHVVDGAVPGGPATPRVRVTVAFCGAASAGGTADAVVLHRSRHDDLALLAVEKPPGFRLRTEVLAPGARKRVGEAVWFVGREGQCRVPPVGGKVTTQPDDAGVFVLDAPGASGGSSGAPVVSGYGIVGMLLADQGDRLLAVDVARIRAVVAGQWGRPWALRDSGNVPPGSIESVWPEISSGLQDYVFNARQIHGFFDRGWVTADNLRQIVPAYNRAYESLDRQRNRHHSEVGEHWGAAEAEAYAALMAEIDEIHREVLAMNPAVHRIYDRRAAREVDLGVDLGALGAQVEQLRTRVDGFLTRLEAGLSPAVTGERR